MSLRSDFPNGHFSDPALFADIAMVERELGITLPDQLRELYLESDGFREPVGDAKYLLSLHEEDTVGSLLSTTLFWWNEWPAIFIDGPDLSRFVFFGRSSGDEVWGISLKAPFEVICYHQSMGSDYEVAGRNIVEVYKADLAKRATTYLAFLPTPGPSSP